MYWLKVDVAVSREAAEALSAAMLSLSPSGILVDEKDDITVLTVYLPDSFDPEEAQAIIKNDLDRIGSQGLKVAPGNVTINLITDEDWAENYRKHFKPLRIGRFVIKPSWKDIEVTPDEIAIQLDPGLAFGTGSHPTTKGCLLFLQEYLGSGEVVFDLGTGSGILAIASAKLGAREVVAIDDDEEAIAVARENAIVNGVSSKIDFMTLGFDQMHALDIDLLVANITAPFIVKFLPEMVRKLKGMKIFIASGITVNQKEAVVMALRENGFTVDKIFIEGDWVTLVSRFG